MPQNYKHAALTGLKMGGHTRIYKHAAPTRLRSLVVTFATQMLKNTQANKPYGTQELFCGIQDLCVKSGALCSNRCGPRLQTEPTRLIDPYNDAFLEFCE